MNSYKGLTTNEVINNRKKYGSNEITKHKKVTLISLIIESLNDPIIKILLIALALKVLFFLKDSDIYEMIGIIIAIILATVISSLSEYASEKAFNKLSETNSKTKSKVIRNKKIEYIDEEEIVKEDLLLVETGDIVTADSILIDGSISVDESMLTGESKEKNKKENDKVYKGSTVYLGRSILKVIDVGDNTLLGKIAKDIEEKPPISPLKEKLKTLAKSISKIGYICALLVMSSYLISTICIKGINSVKELLPHILYALTLAITVVVVAVPEGLPMMITLVLSSNMKKLIKNNVLVRKLVGIETSGSLNILYTDKTGTLTKGKLTMTDFVLCDNTKYHSFNEIDDRLKEIIYLSLVYNNDSIISNNEVTLGNTTDQAIIKYVNNSNKDKYKILERKEFNSIEKYSSVTINYDKKTSFYKGAYEIILNKCSFYLKKDGTKAVINSEINKIASSYTKEGYRVLACAMGCKENLTFIGLILIKDEVRKESKEGIRIVKEAGVQTVMITGDNEITAYNVAKEIGLISSKEDLVLTSSMINKMSDEELKKIIPRLRVLARALPEDKKRLVLLSEELGLVTGMTGDGVNDAPALKKADVGFAMGSGSEVAKEVSDIIILDNNFLSITKTILFGRTIFKSIRKFIIFQLSVNLVTMTLSVIGPLIGIASPLALIQMLWINMIMDSLAAVAFAFEPPLLDYMKEKPKKRNEKIINKYMINEILLTGSFMSIFCLLFLRSNLLQSIYRVDQTNKYVMTAFFSLFIFMNVFNAFNARSERLNIFANLFKNKVFLSVIIFIVLVQLIMIYYGGNIFRTTGLTFYELDMTLLFSSLVLPFDFLRKIVLKKLNKQTGV